MLLFDPDLLSKLCAVKNTEKIATPNKSAKDCICWAGNLRTAEYKINLFPLPIGEHFSWFHVITDSSIAQIAKVPTFQYTNIVIAFFVFRFAVFIAFVLGPFIFTFTFWQTISFTSIIQFLKIGIWAACPFVNGLKIYMQLELCSKPI